MDEGVVDLERTRRPSCEYESRKRGCQEPVEMTGRSRLTVVIAWDVLCATKNTRKDTSFFYRENTPEVGPMPEPTTRPFPLFILRDDRKPAPGHVRFRALRE